MYTLVAHRALERPRQHQLHAHQDPLIGSSMKNLAKLLFLAGLALQTPEGQRNLRVILLQSFGSC